MKKESNYENLSIPEGIVGLTEGEVLEQVAQGHVNSDKTKHGKSYLKIVTDNLLTFFNIVWAIVALVLILVDSPSNLTFLFVVIPNILISIIQETRAKMTVEKLSVTTDPRATVIRDGAAYDINASEIVLGDVIYIETGRQVLSDGVVISGAAEANESMLTGESAAIKKSQGDKVLAGSFLVGGSVFVRVAAVGKDNYVHKIEAAAKSFKAPKSDLFRDLNNLIKYIGIILVPMSLLTFLSNWFAYGKNFEQAVEKTCGSIIGMIPAGVYLLVTLTLTLSVITLGKKKTLVQDMYSIEMLARANVICLDKTGTITDGSMKVCRLEALSWETDEEISHIISALNCSDKSINNTSKALIEHFGTYTDAVIDNVIPFSSSRKYSGATVGGLGTFTIGAPHFVKCPISAELDEKIGEYASLGERILVLAKHSATEEMGEAIALVGIEDRIRPGARETISKFQEQGVCVKVISGDHAATVSSIAAKVGINDADRYLSCEGISNDELRAVANKYTVFGRVTPEQKVLLVKSLQDSGMTVAMTGDGVNDTLALKESDCAIAMAEGSEVARKVSQIVLMESDFTSLPDVVKEGRRCINNVKTSSALFLMKTIFTLILSTLAIITGSGYPFDPKQLIFLELIIIGLGSLLLTVEPNERRTEGSFIADVIKKSLPDALNMLIPVFAVMILSKAGVVTKDAASAIATLTVTAVGFVNLCFLCIPYTKWRATVVSLVGVLLCGAIPLSIFALKDMMILTPAIESPLIMCLVLCIGVFCATIVHICAINIRLGVIKNSHDKKSTEAHIN